MNSSGVYGQYSILLWAEEHYQQWKQNEESYYQENPGFPAMYEDFGTYQDHLTRELKAAQAAIDELEGIAQIERALDSI